MLYCSALYRCVVGYLGTIEMPGGQAGGLQDIRHCIRRLRVEKKVNRSNLKFK